MNSKQASIRATIKHANAEYHKRRAAGDNSTAPGAAFSAAIVALRAAFGDADVDAALDDMDREYEAQCEAREAARME